MATPNINKYRRRGQLGKQLKTFDNRVESIEAELAAIKTNLESDITDMQADSGYFDAAIVTEAQAIVTKIDTMLGL